MNGQLVALLTEVARLLRVGQQERLMPALKVALGYQGSVGMGRLSEGHRRLVVAAHDALAAALPTFDLLIDNLAFFLATRSSVQIAGLAEWAVTLVSVTPHSTRQG